MLQRREFWCTRIMPALATSSLKSLHTHNRSGLSPARRGILVSMEEPRPRLPRLAIWYEEARGTSVMADLVFGGNAIFATH